MRQRLTETVKTQIGVLFICFMIAAVTFLTVFGPTGRTQEHSSTAQKSSVTRPIPPPAPPFTILSITPNAVEKSIAIRFSRPVDLHSILEHISLRPDIYLYKEDSADKQLSADTVSIHSDDFAWQKPYTVIIPEDYEVAGARYKKSVDSFIMPPHPPLIEFLNDHTLIERDSRQLLHFRTNNVDQVLLETLRLPPLLLPIALGAPGSSAQELLPELQKAQSRLAALVNKNSPFSPFLDQAREENSAFSARHEQNKTRAFSVPLSFRKDSGRGAIELIGMKSMNGSSQPLAKSRLYCITDLGLSYKRTRDSLLVWTSSIRYAKPLKSVSVLAVTKDSLIYYLGKTDDRGLLVYESPKPGADANADTAGQKPTKALEGLSVGPSGPIRLERGSPAAAAITHILAATKDDVSFIEVKPKGNVIPAGQDGTNFDPAAIAEDKNWSDLGISNGYVFTERGLYKPGETVYFKGAARSYKDGKIAPPSAGKCDFVLTDSRGNKTWHTESALSAFGTASGSVKLAAYAPLGMYKLEMFFQNDKEPKSSATFQVQEFRPPRHFVRVGFEQMSRENDQYVNIKRSEEVVRIKISGRYYAGGPVKNGQVRWKIFHTGVDRTLEKYKNYTFDYSSADPDEDTQADNLVESSESTLDDKGELAIDFPLDRDVRCGKNDLLVEATVVDFDGRQASESGVFKMRRPFLVGIARHEEKVSPKTAQTLEAIVVDKNDKQVNQGVLQVDVLKNDYITVPYRNQKGDIETHSSVWKNVLSNQLPIKSGQAVFHFDFGSGGKYLLRFTYHDKNGQAFTSATRYDAVPDIFSDYWRVAQEITNYRLASLPLLSDKKQYSPGETAVIFPVPSRPVTTYLVTVEQDEVMSRQIIAADAAKKGIKIPITAACMPNVYISVLGVLPRGGFPLYSRQYDFEAPTAFLGTLNVPVRMGASPLKISIGGATDPIRAKPGEAFSLDLNVADSSGKAELAELAVAVVDESVLQATRFKTPTLDSLLDFQGPLSVATGELRALLQDQTPFHTPNLRPVTGGGGGEQAPGVKIRKNFKPVAYFNPSVVTDAQGHANVSFTLPDNMSTYRIYVVACDRGAQFASAQRMLTLTKDFYLQPGLPAFFTLADRFRFPVGAVNNTDTADKVSLDYTASDNLKPMHGSATIDSLPAHGSGRLYLSGQAVKEGEATVTLVGSLGSNKDGVQVKLPVTSELVMGVSASQGSLGGSGKISMPLDKAALAIPFDKTGYRDVTASLEVSASPMVLLSGPLHYLLEYPYGCIEQKSSGVIALAGLRGLVEKGMVPDITSQQTDKFLAKGIDDIFSMQTASGGFGYWPGYKQSNLWGTLYAVSALGIAAKNGFQIPQNGLKAAISHLQKTILKKENGIGYRAFAAYALSLCGGLDANTFGAVMADYHQEDPITGIYLALADLNIGGKPSDDLEKTVRSELSRPRQNPKRPIFNACYLNQAMALLAGASLIPNDPLTARAAQRLLDAMSKHSIWSSTGDTGWALYALGQYYRLTSAGAGDAGLRVTLTRADGVNQIVQLGPGQAHCFQLDPRAVFSKPEVRISVSPAHKLFYRAAVRFPRLDYAATGHNGGMKLWKKIENTDGRNRIRVGDIVKVTIGIDLGGKEVKRYLALDDPLPAGFVAINSAFETVESPQDASSSENIFSFWSPDGFFMFQPNFFELHQQRVTAFRDIAWPGAYKFIYYARAVCEGVFHVAPTKLEEMYQPEVNAFTPAIKVQIDPAGS
ncbi:MAG: alpha-2-macroglobulin family protein [Syntrophobacteraceae bacterium]